MDMNGDDLYRRAGEDEPFDELQPRLDASDAFDRNEAVSEEDKLTVWDGRERRILYHHGFDRWYRNELVQDDAGHGYDAGISWAGDTDPEPVMRYTYTGGDGKAFKEALEEDDRFERAHGFGSPFYEGPGCTVLIQQERVDITVDTARAEDTDDIHDLSAYGFEASETVLGDGRGHDLLVSGNPPQQTR